MPKEFSYIMEELLHTPEAEINKHKYYAQIIHSVIDIGFADEMITGIDRSLEKQIRREQNRAFREEAR